MPTSPISDAATFRPGATYLAWASPPLPPLWNNSLGPRLWFEGDHIAFQCFGTAIIPFAEIESVDCRGIVGRRIRIFRRGRRIRHVAWFFNRSEARRLLAALEDVGVPLTPRAQDFLAAG